MVQWLPKGSTFRAAVRQENRITDVEERLMDIPEALTGKPHPIRKQAHDAQRAKQRAPAADRVRQRMAARAKRYGNK